MSGISIENIPQSWEQVIGRVGFHAAIHPIEYAKFLIQIGHETMPAYKAKNIYGKEKYFYPSIFAYIGHIKKVDGLSGCYRGLCPNILAKVVGGVACQRVADAIPIENESAAQESLTEEEQIRRFLLTTLRESVSRAAGILASHPLHIIALRTMAEFVGRDGLYTGVLCSFGVIYEQEGVLGFFAGLFPRLLCDFGSVWVSNTVVYLVNNYYIEDKDAKMYANATLRFLIGTMFYPFHVVSSCMAITGSSLSAAQPPQMPVYESWLHCYKHLRLSNALRRGSSILWREAAQPLMMTMSGQPMTPDFFNSIKQE